MSRVFKARMEILPHAQRLLWPTLKPARQLGLVLYGCTAIALRLGHRPSIDFDFFSAEPLDRNKIHAAFPFMAEAVVLQDEANALTVTVPIPKDETAHRHVKLSFFGSIGFGRVGDPQLSDDGVLEVASLEDLMATKVKAVLQRVEAKDYRDIAALVNAGVSLPHGLAAARALFGASFQPSESLKALVYFKGGDLQTLTEAEKNTLVNAVGAVRDLPVVSIVSNRLIA